MNNKERKKDRNFAIVIFAASICLIGISFSYPAKSSIFPRFLSILLMVWSIILFLRRCGSQRPSTDTSDQSLLADSGAENRERKHRQWWRNPMLWLFVMIIIYGILINLLGFFTASLLYIAGTMVFLGNRSLLALIIWPFLISILLYGIFRVILGVHLPDGYLM